MLRRQNVQQLNLPPPSPTSKGRGPQPSQDDDEWNLRDHLYRAEWGERDPYVMQGSKEKSPRPGYIDNQYGIMLEINTPRDLRGLTRRWLPEQETSKTQSSKATVSNKFAFGTAFHGLLERLRKRLSTMSVDELADLCQCLRKIDGKVKEEIHQYRKAKALAKQLKKDKYSRTESVDDELSLSGRMRIVAIELHAMLERVDVQASLEDCLKVVNTAASHGRVALVLETLVRGVWEQTDKEVERDAEEKDHDVDLERSKSVNINVASLKMREGHPANISALLLTTNGQQLFSGDQDGNVKVWRLIDGEQVKLSGSKGRVVKLTAHVHMHGAAAQMALAATGMHTRLKVSEGTDLLVGVSDDGSLCCWDLDRHVLRWRISRAHDDAISSLCIPAVDMDWPGLTITASEDAVIRIWDTRPMMEIPLQSLQIDQEWAIAHLRKNGLFSEMSDGDLMILLHSMQIREFEPLERIIWSSAEMESEDRHKQGVKEDVQETPGSRTREKSTDVIVFVVSGIAIATADEVVIRNFRPGECLGGAGWNGFYGSGEYNGVAKSKCRCLVLHKHMYQLIAERDYGHMLSTYLTDGLIESDWKDLTSQQRQGFGSILGVKDQQFLAQYEEKLGLGGSYNFAARTHTSMTSPSTSNPSSHKKASVPFAGGTMTPRENKPPVGAETLSRKDESFAGKTEIASTPLSGVQKSSQQNLQSQQGSDLYTDDIPVPMTPFSVKKKRVDGIENASSEDAEVAVAGEGDTLVAENSFPSPTLCAAAQLYRRKLTGGNTWRLLAELKGHKEAVTCLASDDKGRLLSGSRDKTLRLWDLRKIVSSIRESQGSSTRCMHIYSGLADVHTLTVVTPGQESEIHSHGHLSWVTDVAINNSSTLAVSISYDSTIRVWSLKEGELGHHLRTIKCARELNSMRLESLCITDDAEFAFVCGPAGVFQVWRLIDGSRVSGIDWGAMCDATGEPVGDRIEFKALSISRGASIVATCRNADIVLWESGTGDGILNLVVPDTSVDSSSHSLKKFAKTVITAHATISKAFKTTRENKSAQSSEDAKPTSEGFGKKHHQHPAASVPMPTGKIISLPGTLEEKRSEREDASAKEYYDLKLQMKDLVKDLKEEIRSECSKLKDTRLPSPVRKTDKRESVPNRDSKDSPVRASLVLQNADKSIVKSKKQKYGWTCRNQDALQELKDGGVVADSDSADTPTLLVMHSEALVYGKYSWAVTVKSDCSLRVGIASSEKAALPLESDLTDPNSEYWSWYLQADRFQGVELCKNFAGEYSPQEGVDFGRKGDVLEITLDCRSGQLSFDAKRGEEYFRWNFSPDSGLSRHQGVSIARAPNSDDRSVEKTSSNSESGQEAETQSLSKAPSKTQVAEDIYGQEKKARNERRLYAFIELFGEECDCVEISRITHESRIPAKIRTFFKEMSESLQNSKVVRPIESSEISYKGGSVEINGRCGGSKNLEQSASTVTINWPRTALPGPTKMEVRVCPPPGNSDASCDARYTAGIDKLNSGRVVGLVVDLRPHGLEFNLPITIRIPHGLVMDGDENWQNQMEGVKLDGFKEVMDVPNCLFTCIDGKFDNKYGLLTVKSTGIFGLKASRYCSDVVHAKVYCKPGPTLLEKRNGIAAHLRPSIDLKMHEVTPENYPEVFFGSSEALPMSIKFCGVFCQDEEFKDVLKAPIYYLPYRARIITMSIKEHGYALGVNLVLSPPVTKSSLMSFAQSSTDDALDPDDLNMINMIYFGGPLILKFGISAKAGKDAADLLNHPSYHLQELKVSLKLRGNISALLDQDSDAQLKQLIKQKRLQQHISLMPFPVLVRKLPPKKKWKNAMEELSLMESMSDALSGGLPKEGCLKQVNELQLCGNPASACDLFVIRNPSAQPNVREREIQVLRFLENHGWTFNDLSFRILEGKGVSEDEYLQVNNSKAVLVFAETDMFEDKLPPQLPLVKMWIAAIRAHGIDAEKRFGGDGIIILSTAKIPVVGNGIFPDDASAWRGQVGERLQSYRQNHIHVEPSENMTKLHDFLTQKVKAGPNGLSQERNAFFKPPIVSSEEGKFCGRLKSQKVVQDIPSVKYVCERVLSMAREVALGAEVDLDTCIKIYFDKHNADAQEFWMSLENEFAVDIHDDDILKAQAFYAAVRMIHVRLCKKLCIVSAIRDARPSPKWLEMEWTHQAAGITPRLSAQTSQGGCKAWNSERQSHHKASFCD